MILDFLDEESRNLTYGEKILAEWHTMTLEWLELKKKHFPIRVAPSLYLALAGANSVTGAAAALPPPPCSSADAAD